MPKIAINVTVDKEVYNIFKTLCNKNDIKISTKINTLMKNWIKEHGK